MKPRNAGGPPTRGGTSRTVRPGGLDGEAQGTAPRLLAESIVRIGAEVLR